MKFLPFALLMGLLYFTGCKSDSATRPEEVSTRGEVPAKTPLRNPYGHISDLEARSLLQKAITGAGGLENWQKVKNLKFKKYFALYTEDGETEQEALQNHEYHLGSPLEVAISWVDGQDKHLLSYREGRPEKSVNGTTVADAEPQSLTNTVLSATFVIQIPFNLLDPGVELAYDGTDQLHEGQKVEVLRATYNPGEHANHSTPDTWWHYFDAETYQPLGYMVQHADHYSFVQNLELAEAGGILFPKVRKSYRADRDKNLKYLRAEYDYGEYVVD